MTSISILISTACEKDELETAVQAIIVRDCTGTYLRHDGMDFHVCNIDKVESFANSETISVTFKKLGTCNGTATGSIVCDMLHISDGWIEVVRIN
jgi:hypothetical protein